MKRPFFKVLVLLLVGVAGGVFAFDQVRVQVERVLSSALEIPVHIERLTYLPGRVTLHRTHVYPPTFSDSNETASVPPASPVLTIDRLELEGSLFSLLRQRSVAALQQGAVQSVAVTGITLSVGGVPLKAQGRVFLTTSAQSPARCEGWLKMEHPLLKGRVELSGRLLEPVLLGWFERVGGQPRHFVSQFRIDSDAIRIAQMEIQGGWWAAGLLRLGELPSSSVEGSQSLESASWRGELELLRPAEQVEPQLRYGLKFKPLSSGTGRAVLWMHREAEAPKTLETSWEMEGSTLQFAARFLEKKVLFSGEVSLSPPFPVGLTLELNEAAIPELAKWILPEREAKKIRGQVQGRVVFHGTLEKLMSQGHLSVKNTLFGGQRFPSASLRFQGEGPILQFRESHLTRPAGDLLMEGVVDLRRIGQPDFFRAITLTSMEKSLEVGGWQVSPLTAPVLQRAGLQESRGVRIRRASSENASITVGLAYEVDKQMGPETVSREGMELGIAISEDKSVKLRLEGEEQFLGIEHRKKF